MERRGNARDGADSFLQQGFQTCPASFSAKKAGDSVQLRADPCPRQSHISEPRPPEPQNAAGFGGSACKEGIPLKRGRVAPNPARRGPREETQTRRSCRRKPVRSWAFLPRPPLFTESLTFFLKPKLSFLSEVYVDFFKRKYR